MVNRTNYKVSDTMSVDNALDVKPHYMVMKLGDKVFSTRFGNKEDLLLPGGGVDFIKSILSKSNTTNIGFESNLHITGVFSEIENHQKIRPVHFDLSFYSELDHLTKPLEKSFNPDNFRKIFCDMCKSDQHLYCTKCRRYCWEFMDQEINKVNEELPKP